MTWTTGNIYCGLHEFEEMAFLLHLLRPEDLFVDIGANVGSYTILASAAIGARTTSIEPIPKTFSHLMDNIYLNDIRDKVEALNMGVSRESGFLKFTSNLDTTNHVATDEKPHETATLDVKVDSLNHIVGGREPALIKIDVEGFETEVIAGGDQVFSRKSLSAVVIEQNGSGGRYNYDEKALHQKILDYGFRPFRYLPFERRLVADKHNKTEVGDVIYVKNQAFVEQRLKTAPAFRVRGQNV